MTSIAEKMMEAAKKSKGHVSKMVLRQKDGKATQKKASPKAQHPKKAAKVPTKTQEPAKKASPKAQPAKAKTATARTSAKARTAKTPKPARQQEQAPNYEIPVDLTAALLKSLKPSRRYRIVRALLTKQAVRMMVSGKDGYMTEEYMQNLFTKLGDWINEAARKARVRLPLDLIEKAFYAEMQENTGMDFSKMAGLIDRTTPTQKTMTVIAISIQNPETNNRLVKKFADKIGKKPHNTKGDRRHSTRPRQKSNAPRQPRTQH